MTVWNDFLAHTLADKRAQDNERSLTPMARDGLYAEVAGQRLLNLAGNDYLALGTRNEWQREFGQQLEAQGQYWSSSSSQLLTGHSPLHQQLEATLAHLFQREAALTFASGYQMNFGLLNALSTGNVLILADKLVHASMVDGLLISKAKFLRYHHNDMAHLHALLCQHHAAFERIIIVTESVFSMDGDIADLQQLVAFKREFANVALPDDFDKLLITTEFDVVYRHSVHLAYYSFIVRRYYLCAVVPIGFVPVVDFRIVRSSDYNTALASKFTDSIRDFGCRP